MSQDDRQHHPCKDCEAEILYHSLRECPRLGRDVAVEGCNRLYNRTKAGAWKYINDELGNEEIQAYYAQRREEARVRKERYGA